MRPWNRMFGGSGGGSQPERAPADAPTTSVNDLGQTPAAGQRVPPLLPTFLAIVTVSAALFFSIAAAMCVVVAFAELFRAEDMIVGSVAPLGRGPWHDRHCMFVVFSLLGVALAVWSFSLLQRVVRTFGPEAFEPAARGRIGPSHPRPWEYN